MRLQLNRSGLGALVLVLALLGFVGACDEGGARMYKTSAIAPSYQSWAAEKYMDILGASVVDKGVNFAVYSENATRIELLLFSDPEAARPRMRIPMTKAKSNVWTAYVEGLGVGQHYGYIAWGPNWPYTEEFYPGSTMGYITDCDEHGNRFNPNKLLIDPYTLRIHRDFDWSKGNPASGSARHVSSWGAAAKSVVIRSEYQWSENERRWREMRMRGDAGSQKQSDLIVYEVHAKGFTAGSDSKVSVPGTFKGVGDKAKYLKELGITAVELLPIMEKTDDGTYWGYNTLAFFVPEQRYADPNNKKLNAVMDEFKAMVDALHAEGIEVILDIVYNHTGEGGFWRSKLKKYNTSFSYGWDEHFDDVTSASIFSFRGLDNAAYYELGSDTSPELGKCAYRDDTGVGNQVRTNHVPFRRLILDNLRFWVEEMHVDGFRFDLATVLGMKDLEPWIFDPENTVVQDIIDDPVLKKYNTRLIAEPWHFGAYGVGKFPKSKTDAEFAWFDWNDKFRNMWREFINGDSLAVGHNEGISIGGALTGSAELFRGGGRKPFHSVNFITAHDGFTLFDLVSYNQKHNMGGPLNPICLSNPASPFCDTTSGDDNNRSRNWCPGDEQNGCKDPEGYAVKRQMVRNFFAALLFSQGTPMILGGDEWMRTQYGNNNAYSDSADNEFNWFRWGDWAPDNERQRMYDFVKNAISLRKELAPRFSPESYEDIDWRGSDGNPPDWGSRHIMMYWPPKEGLAAVALCINMEGDPNRVVSFQLPEVPGGWQVAVDTQLHYDSGEVIDAVENKKISRNIYPQGEAALEENRYGLKSRTIVLLKQKQ
ncbi:MAG: glycogen debranching protein [Bradymonadia bacterium]